MILIKADREMTIPAHASLTHDRLRRFCAAPFITDCNSSCSHGSQLRAPLTSNEEEPKQIL